MRPLQGRLHETSQLDRLSNQYADINLDAIANAIFIIKKIGIRTYNTFQILGLLPIGNKTI